MISPLMSCLPPTLVGGQRSRTLFLEPASAGLLEELKSPAEAGSRGICRSSNHQLKLVANSNMCLCVSRFMRNPVNRWAILTRPAGASRNESRITSQGPRTTKHGPRRVIALSRDSHRSPGKLLTRSNSHTETVRADKSNGDRRAPETQNNEKPYWPNEPTLAASTTASIACGRLGHCLKGDLRTPDIGKPTEPRTTRHEKWRRTK